MEGMPVARAAREHGLQRMGLSSHMKKHAKRDLLAAMAKRNGMAGTDLLQRVSGYIEQAEKIMRGALAAQDRDAAVKALRAAHEILRTQGELTGELSQQRVLVQLGVTVEVAQRRLAAIDAARGLPPGEVAERALAVLERLNLSPTQAERCQRLAERAGRLNAAATT